MREIFHALGLHMHQPPDNLRLLQETNAWEARQIIFCYERPAKFIRKFSDYARLNIGFSGILLDQLTDPDIQKDFKTDYEIDLDEALERYRQPGLIEILGMGYYHPIFPLIPVEDWEDQLNLGREKAKETFGVKPVGFWPSEMAFCMEMIPALRKAGYEYVVVDSVHVRPEEGEIDRADFIYRPHMARHEGYEIIVIPRDRDISNAQESGLNASWFKNEIINKTSYLKAPGLVTTWSDGENGGWFRQMDEASGFWGHFFTPYMEMVKEGGSPVKPVLLSDYIADHPPSDYVTVKTGAWNVGNTSGFDFSQWSGSASQKRALEEVWKLSRDFHRLEEEVEKRGNEIRAIDKVNSLLVQAKAWLLKAETSCYFFWGDAWIPKVYDQTKPARILLKKIGEILT